MRHLIPVKKRSDIPEPYRKTPIGRLLEYHNLGRTFETYAKAQLLIGMCMDNRKYLHIPDNFAFILRAGGANLLHSQFKVSFVIAVGGVSTIALIGHTHCAMVNLKSKKRAFVDGLVEKAGWKRAVANRHFQRFAPQFEIGDAAEFTLRQAEHLENRYPKTLVVPMIYKVEDNLLYLLR